MSPPLLRDEIPSNSRLNALEETVRRYNVLSRSSPQSAGRSGPYGQQDIGIVPVPFWAELLTSPFDTSSEGSSSGSGSGTTPPSITDGIPGFPPPPPGPGGGPITTLEQDLDTEPNVPDILIPNGDGDQGSGSDGSSSGSDGLSSYPYGWREIIPDGKGGWISPGLGARRGNAVVSPAFELNDLDVSLLSPLGRNTRVVMSWDGCRGGYIFQNPYGGGGGVGDTFGVVATFLECASLEIVEVSP